MEGSDGVLHIWAVHAKAQALEKLHTLRGHGAAVGAVACCEPRQLVLSAAADATVRSWCLGSGAPLLRLPLIPAFATAGLPPPSPTAVPTANDLMVVSRGPQAADRVQPEAGPGPRTSREPWP